MSVFGFIVLVIATASSNNLPTCIYTNQYQGTLDLRVFESMTFNFSSYWFYQYTPCRNNLQCYNDTKQVMITVNDNYNRSNCESDGGIYNDTYPEQPRFILHDPYNIYPNNSWYFGYSGGPCLAIRGGTIYTEIYWSCDTSVPLYNMTYWSLGSGCTLAMYINTQYACPKLCQWNDGYGNILDLTFVQNEIISYIDTNSGYKWLYTPCSNGLQCTNINDNDHMITLNSNNPKTKCIQSLANWNETLPTGGTNVTHDKINGIWQFVYLNGDKCNGLQNVMEVYWICNETITNNYTVTNAIQIEECLFELKIESPLVC